MNSLHDPRRPNILVVLADQLRRQSLGSYGDPNASTPNLDALAADGTQFDNACATYPVCVPSRFTIMTGEFAHSRMIPAIEWRMSPAERTLAHEFNDAGYQTLYFGKWHLYGGHGLLADHTTVKANRTPVPVAHQGGWQRWFGFELSNAHFDTVYFEDADPKPRLIEGYQADGLFHLAMDAIDSADERPFFAVVSVEAPHPPFVAPEDYLGRWQDREMQLRDNFREVDGIERVSGGTVIDDLRAYYAMIENLDDNLGRLLASLHDCGRADDTIVMLVSDHGELLGSHGLVSKMHPYEESVGIPFIVHDPRSAPETPRRIQDPVSTEDIYPTLLGLAGIPVPPGKPGLDLSGVIRGEKPGTGRENVLLELVAEFRRGFPYFERTWRCLRGRRYKYTVLGGPEGGRPWQLFDLEQDPFELHNLVDDSRFSDVLIDLHAGLGGVITETGDHYVLAAIPGARGVNAWDDGPGGPTLASEA